MVEKIIRSSNELVDFIYQVIDIEGVLVRDVEKIAGVSKGMLSRWKSSKQQPRVNYIVHILNYLDVAFILKSSKDSQNKQIEQEIHSLNEVLEFVYLCIHNKGISAQEIEKQANLSHTILSRWKNNSSSPTFNSLMNVLDSLNIEIILRMSEYEEKKLNKVNEDILSHINTIISSDMLLPDREQILRYLKYKYSTIDNQK